jgi:hypothetical protein
VLVYLVLFAFDVAVVYQLPVREDSVLQHRQSLLCYLCQDGFPRTFVEENQFQRQATLLLYLNGVEEGGRTRFSHLDLSIKPRCGRALLFYPAFADGNPDPRYVSPACLHQPHTHQLAHTDKLLYSHHVVWKVVLLTEAE